MSTVGVALCGSLAPSPRVGSCEVQGEAPQQLSPRGCNVLGRHSLKRCRLSNLNSADALVCGVSVTKTED